MKGFLAEQNGWLQVELLPAYGQELNRLDGLWANLKSRELANRCEDQIETVDRVARVGQLPDGVGDRCAATSLG